MANEVKIVFSADGSKLTAVVDGVTTDLAKLGKTAADAADQATGSMSATRRGIASISEQLKDAQSSLIEYGKAAAAAFVASQAWDMAKDYATTAARYETLGVVMQTVGRNAGYTGQQMLDVAKGVQAMGITMLESRDSVTKMASAHIDLSKAQGLARIAQDAAVIGGINSSEAFKAMIYGIQSGQIEVLRTIGINVNFEDSYKKLALQLGTTADALTEAEKTTARTNAVMGVGGDIAGAYSDAMGTAGKQMTSLARYSEDAKVKLGAVFNDTLLLALGVYTGHLKDSNAELDKLTANKDIEDWSKNAAVLFAGMADTIKLSWSGVATIFDTIGTGLLQLNAMAHFDFKGVTNAGLNFVGRTENRFDTGALLGSQLKELQAKRDLGARSMTGANGVVQVFSTPAAMSEAKDEIAAQKKLNSDRVKAAEDAVAAIAAVMKKGMTNEQKNAADLEKFRRVQLAAGADMDSQEIKAAEAVILAHGKKAAAASEYDKLAQSISAKIALQNAEAISADKLNEADKLKIDLYDKIDAGLLKLSLAQKLSLDASLDELDTAIKVNAVKDQSAKYLAESNKAHFDAVIAQKKHTTSIQDQVEKQLEHNAAIGLSTLALGDLEAANINLQAAELERKASLQDGVMWDATITEGYAAQAKALRDLAAATVAGAQKQTSFDAAKDMAAQQKKAAEESARHWEDALMRAFESGKGFFQSLWDTIKNTLKTQVLKVGIQGVMGSLGMGAAGAASAGTSGGVGDVFSAASAYDKFTSGFASTSASMLDIGGTMARQTGLAASSLINNGFTTAGTALADSAKWLADSAQAINKASDILGYATAAYSLTEGKIATAAGQAIGTYFGGAIGSYIGGKIGGLVDSFFGGETRSGAAYVTGADGKAAYQQGPSGGEIAGTQARAMFDATQATIKNTLLAFGSKATLTGYNAGLESSGNGKGFDYAGGYINGTGFGEYAGRDGGQLAMHSQDSQQAFTDYGTQLAQSIIEALQATPDIPKTITDIITQTLGGAAVSTLSSDATTKLLDTLNAVAGTVNVFNVAVAALPFEQLKSLSFDAAAGLIAAAGGMEKLGANLGTYYSNFYTAEEQRAQTIANINAATAGSGLDATTATRESFRAIVEAQDVTTESGQKTYAALLSVSGAFAALNPLVADTASALQKAADAAAIALAKTNAGWQDQLDVLTGAATDRSIALRDTADESTRALMNQVYAQQDLIAATTAAKDAADALTQAQADQATAAMDAATALAATNKGWQDQLDILTGAQTDRSIALRDTTDETTRTLMRQVYAQQDLKTASDAAAIALQGMIDAATSSKTSLADKYKNPLTLQSASAMLPAGVADGLLGMNPTDVRNAIGGYISGLDPLTEAGRAAITQLTGLAPALDVLVAQVDSVAAAAAQAAANLPTFADGVNAAMSALKSSIDAQKTLVTDAYTAQLDSVRAALDTVTGSVGKLKSLSDSLKGTLDGMRVAGSDGEYRAAAQAQISAALAVARNSGTLPLDGQLTSALATVSKPSEALYGTFTAYARDFYKTANDIAALSDITGTQLTAEEVTQKILTNQLTALKAGFDSQIKALNSLADTAQAQVDAALGINSSVLSVTDALNNLAAALGVDSIASSAATSGSALGISKAQTRNGVAFAGTQAWRIGDLSYDSIGNAYMAYGPTGSNPGVYTSAQIEEMNHWAKGVINTWADTKNLPHFEQGINYVPEDMVAFVHKGEEIKPARFNPYNPNAQQTGNSETAAALRELADRLDQIEVNTRAIAGHTAGTDRKLARVIPGNALITVAA